MGLGGSTFAVMEVRVLDVEEAAAATGTSVAAIRERMRRDRVWHILNRTKVVLIDGQLATPDAGDQLIVQLPGMLAAAESARAALEAENQWLLQEREIADRRLTEASLRLADIMDLTSKQLREQTLQAMDRAEPRRNNVR